MIMLDGVGGCDRVSRTFFLMSGEDFESLVSFFGPAINNKNINFRNAISDGKLDRSTETSFN